MTPLPSREGAATPARSGGVIARLKAEREREDTARIRDEHRRMREEFYARDAQRKEAA